MFYFQAKFTDKYGNDQYVVVFNDWKHVNSNPFTLAPINRYLEKGWKLYGNKDIGLQLKKGNYTITFDIPIQTNDKGVLWCIHAMRLDLSKDEEAPKCVLLMYSLIEAHHMLGHINKHYVRKAAANLKMKIMNEDMPPCESCSMLMHDKRISQKQIQQLLLSLLERSIKTNN